MPYIPPAIRKFLQTGVLPANVGELTWAISVLVDKYVGQEGVSYAVITEVRGALHGVLTEFDRKIAFPYEDRKCEENGEVFVGSLAALEERA